VNLLLVSPDEVVDGMCSFADRRAEHLRRVLRVKVGQVVRAGVIGGPLASAEVVSDDGIAIAVRLGIGAPPAPPLPIDMIIAVPRPKAVSRVVETCAAFAVRSVTLTNAWRVDKSYLRSPRLDPSALAHAARLGAEQGATTHVPAVAVCDRLMAVLDARADNRSAGLRLIAHPGAPPIETVASVFPDAIAVGPEGGWIERELATFVARGFVPCSFGAPIVRVEAAVVALLAQVLLIHRQNNS
jgi:RsmE family RNA methyltransferase